MSSRTMNPVHVSVTNRSGFLHTQAHGMHVHTLHFVMNSFNLYEPIQFPPCTNHQSPTLDLSILNFYSPIVGREFK